MSTPSSLTINLPPKFSNSFWSSPEYRLGVEAIYSRLQIGLDENSSILSLVEHRTSLEYSHAEQLATPSPTPNFSTPLFKNVFREGSSKGSRVFSAGASSASNVFRTIEAEAIQNQASVHAKVARNLEKTILIPFEKWSEEHKDKVQNSWQFVDANLQKFERQRAEVDRLRSQYETKCRQADEAEDDARFAGGELASPPYTSSDSETVEKRAHIPQDVLPTSENIQSTEAASMSMPNNDNTTTTDPDRIKRRETIREQFGFRKATAQANNGTDKYTPLSPRSASAEITGSQKSMEDDGHVTGGMKRSNTLSSALSSAISKASEVPAFQNLRAVVGVLNEPRHLRLRKEAESAEIQYKEAVRILDKVRCELEEILVNHFEMVERWEFGRLVAVKRVLAAFNAAFLPLLPTLSASLQRSTALETALNPEQTLIHTILDSRTGPYQPQPQVFHPYYHDDPSSLAGAGTAGFGMDLSAFMRAETLASESGETRGEIRAGAGNSQKLGMPAIPLALMALLASLERIYEDPNRWPKPKEDGESESMSLSINEEKRKSWIYEVPLANSHMCREAIISHLLGQSVPGANVGAGLETKLKRFDAPTLAATVKLWAMELTDSLITHDLWDAVDNTYRAAASQEYDARVIPSKSVGEEMVKEKEESSTDVKGKGRSEGMDPVLEETIRKGVLADLGVILSKLPKIHLVCLDAIIGHLARLVKATPTNESNSVYLNKVALSLGRVLIRPVRENASTLRSRSPILLTHDLVKFYNELLPSLLEKKAKESEAALTAQRRTPIRKRTKPVDQRMSRSRMAAAGVGLPMVPPKENPSSTIPSSNPSPPPKVVTQLTKEKDEDDDTPTPIASRILDSSSSSNNTSNSNTTLAVAEPDPTTRIKSPSSVSAASSSYDTPEEDEGEGEDGGTAAIPTSAATTSSNTPSLSTPAADEDKDKPISNVARLSRQFGSSGSIKSGVRGPRAANTSTSTSTK